MPPDGISEWILPSHARTYLTRRKIDPEIIEEILRSPQARYTVRAGREVFQSLRLFGNPPKPYVVRIFVDTDRTPAEVVTAYRTSKIAKYWK